MTEHPTHESRENVTNVGYGTLCMRDGLVRLWEDGRLTHVIVARMAHQTPDWLLALGSDGC